MYISIIALITIYIHIEINIQSHYHNQNKIKSTDIIDQIKKIKNEKISTIKNNFNPENKKSRLKNAKSDKKQNISKPQEKYYKKI